MRRASRMGTALLVAGLALGGAGCAQTTSQAVSEPVIGAPLVLNSAPGSTVAPAPLAPAATTASPPGTVAATALAPAPVAPAPVAVAPAPAPAAVKPLPVAPQPLATAASDPVEPMPTTAPDPAAEGSFPNINAPPAEPGGTLLPAEERARIIAELEALRARQGTGGGGGGGNASDLANQGETHGQDAIKQIEACSEEGALQNNPACAAAD